jgi:hypothetical protein
MARGVGIMFILIGLLTITGMISLATEGNEMTSTGTDMISMNMNNPSQEDSETNDIKHNTNMNMNMK